MTRAGSARPTRASRSAAARVRSLPTLGYSWGFRVLIRASYSPQVAVDTPPPFVPRCRASPHPRTGNGMTDAAALLIDKIRSRTARVGIIGLGYVGLPLARAF